MTKGEYPLSSNEAETIHTGQDSLVGLQSFDGVNNVIGFNKNRIPNRTHAIYNFDNVNSCL
jgi:hypothetical protein